MCSKFYVKKKKFASIICNSHIRYYNWYCVDNYYLIFYYDYNNS